MFAQVNVQYNSIRGDQWNEQIKEKRKIARGVLLYLEERYKQIDKKISNFDSFPHFDSFDLRVIQRCGASRSEYCAPAHFVEKPGRVPLALRRQNSGSC